MTEQTILTPKQAEDERGKRGYMRVMRGESPGFDKLFEYIGSLSRETFDAIVKQLEDAANGR